MTELRRKIGGGGEGRKGRGGFEGRKEESR